MKSLPINNRKPYELNRLCRHHDIAPLFLNHYLDKESKHPIDKLGIGLLNDVVEILSISYKNIIDNPITFP